MSKRNGFFFVVVGETVDSHSLTVFSVHLQCIFKVNGLFVEVIVYRSSKKKIFVGWKYIKKNKRTKGVKRVLPFIVCGTSIFLPILMDFVLFIP